jgi:hypothetical protein
MMFKWLPDTPIAWRDVWLGAILSAALFEVGKFLIGLYIGKQGLESTYGAAASIVVVLIWADDLLFSRHGVLQCAEAGRFATPTAPRPASARDSPWGQDTSARLSFS